MKVIARGRRSGKTLDLIKESALSGNYILVRNHSEAQRLFQLAKGNETVYSSSCDGKRNIIR